MAKISPHKHYLKTLAFSTPMILLVVVATNFLVDPYGIYDFINIEKFNANKPSMQSHLRMSKAYQVRNQQPQAIVLGTSRAEFGLDPDHPGFSHRPTYNLNLSGGNIYEILRYFQHAYTVSQISQVVLALDFFQFDVNSENRPDFYEKRLAANLRGFATNHRMPTRDLFDSLLTLDALLSSLNTISSQFQRPTYLRNGLIDPATTIRGKLIHIIGQRELFIINEQRYFNKTYDGFSLRSDDGTSRSLSNYRMLLGLAYAKDIDLKIVINPSHARQFETLAAKGLWPTFEEWKIQLVKINEEEAKGVGETPFLIWDFSGYSTYTTEPVPVSGDTASKMVWYWESSHFTKELGNLVLDKIFESMPSQNKSALPFGVVLTSNNIDAHLRNIKRQRGIWRKTHPSDVSEIELLLD